MAGRAPLVYVHAGNRPSDEGEREGNLELAYIPGFVDSLSDNDEPYLPWLRVGLESTDASLPDEHRRRADVVLDRRQVSALHAYLGQWLGNTAAGDSPEQK